MVFQLVILAALVATAELAPAMPAYQTSPNIFPGPSAPSTILPYPDPYLDSPIFFDNYQIPQVSQSLVQGHHSQNYVIIDQSPIQLPTILQSAYQNFLDTITRPQVYVPQPQPMSIPAQSLPIGSQPKPIPTPIQYQQPISFIPQSQPISMLQPLQQPISPQPQTILLPQQGVVISEPQQVYIQQNSPVLQTQPQPYQLRQVQQPYQPALMQNPYQFAQFQQPYQLAQIQQPVQLVQTY